MYSFFRDGGGKDEARTIVTGLKSASHDCNENYKIKFVFKISKQVCFKSRTFQIMIMTKMP